MDLLAFERDRSFVLKALRRGEIDYLEPVTEAVEADFFRHLIGRQVLDRLAESYHVHPRLLRSGGLIDAL